MSYLDKQEALIPLVPESLKDKQEKSSTFKVFSAPGDTTSTRYDFRMYHIDGTEGVAYLLVGGVDSPSSQVAYSNGQHRHG